MRPEQLSDSVTACVYTYFRATERKAISAVANARAPGIGRDRHDNGRI